jgi:hypothetical protein
MAGLLRPLTNGAIVMTSEERNLADASEPEGQKQFNTHVTSPLHIYGKLKGPAPGALFQHSFATRPSDRARGGFFSGPAVVRKRDHVAGGHEEGKRLAPAQKGEDPPLGVTRDHDVASD